MKYLLIIAVILFSVYFVDDVMWLHKQLGDQVSYRVKIEKENDLLKKNISIYYPYLPANFEYPMCIFNSNFTN